MMLCKYRDLSKSFKKDEIEDMVSFGILDIVSRKGSLITSFIFKLNTLYPASELIKKRNQIKNLETALNIEKEWDGFRRINKFYTV
ncbi:MAG: hypothetical protein ACP5N7_06295 [Candidatus Pacearchaeota archaeon]